VSSTGVNKITLNLDHHSLWLHVSMSVASSNYKVDPSLFSPCTYRFLACLTLTRIDIHIDFFTKEMYPHLT